MSPLSKSSSISRPCVYTDLLVLVHNTVAGISELQCLQVLIGCMFTHGCVHTPQQIGSLLLTINIIHCMCSTGIMCFWLSVTVTYYTCTVCMYMIIMYVQDL